MSTQNVRAPMALYIQENAPACLLTTIIFAEKEINAQMINVDRSTAHEELFELNPYGSTPTLMTKDMVIYEADIIFEYLEERFPFPPLLSSFPMERARARILSRTIQNEWIALLQMILDGNADAQAKETLQSYLKQIAPIVKKQSYLMGDKICVIDCWMGAILYYLPNIFDQLPGELTPVINYAKKLFARPSFQQGIQMYVNACQATEAQTPSEMLHDEPDDDAAFDDETL